MWRAGATVANEEEPNGFTFRDRRGTGDPVNLAPVRATPVPPAGNERASAIWTPPSVRKMAPAAKPESALDAPIPDANVNTLPDAPEGEPLLDPESGIPSVYQVLSEQLMMMQQIAVVRLGLAPDPMTHLPAVNLREAKVAVEILTYVAERLQPVLQPEEVGQITQMVKQIRSRYVEAIQMASEGP